MIGQHVCNVYMNGPREILVHGEDEAGHDDRVDDGSAGGGDADHEIGGDGASQRTVLTGRTRAETFHSTVSATHRNHQKRGKLQREKNTNRVRQKQAKHGVSQMW